MDRNMKLLAVVAVVATQCAAFAQDPNSAFSTAPIDSKDSRSVPEQKPPAPKTGTGVATADFISQRQTEASVNDYLFVTKRIVANIFLVAGPIWAVWCFVVAGLRLLRKKPGAGACFSAGVILCLITLLSMWTM